MPEATSSSGPGRARGEAANRERRTVDRQRRDDDVDPRAVGEPRVHHRAELVDPAAQRGQDPLDRVAKRPLRGEPDLGRLDPPAALDVDLVGAVDHHLVDRGVREQLLERAEADRVAQDQLADPGAARLREHRGVIVDQLRHRALEVVAARPPRGRLGPAALDQAPPQIGGERLGVAIGRSHATVNPAAGRGRPRQVPSRVAVDSAADGGDRGSAGRHHEARGRRDRQCRQHRPAHGGGVAGAIVRAGGRVVQDESDALAPIGLGEAVATSAGELPARWVIHAATMHLGGPTSAEIIREATASTLAQGRRAGRQLAGPGRLRHRRGRLSRRRGGADRGRGGAPPPRGGRAASSGSCSRLRRRRARAFEAALASPDAAPA